LLTARCHGRYILDIQRDEQLKIRTEKRRVWKGKFDAKWRKKEFQMVMAAREEKWKWIKNRSVSRVPVDKRFAELRMQVESTMSPK